jgi:hypothetical protein
MGFPMAEQSPTPDLTPKAWADTSPLHIASGQDAAEADDQADRLNAILSRADQRDQAAERRESHTEERYSADGDPHAAIVDRYWAGRDRDAAAEDRADLIEILRPRQFGGPTT